MGTRNILTIKVDNKTKVVQYCQWDGYPKGQGVDIARFLQQANIELFTEKVRELTPYTDEEIKAIWVNAGANPNSDLVSLDVSKRVAGCHPELSRDTGAGILPLIASGAVKKVALSVGQLNQSWIEYLYEINLDTKVVNVSLDGGRSFVKATAFAQFTEDYMPMLEDILYKIQYPDEE